MNKLLPLGRTLYSIATIGLGVLCILSLDFIIGRPPQWPAGISVNPFLAYISGSIVIIAGIAILAKQKGYEVALIIAGLILILGTSRHISNVMADWLNTYKSLALAGGAFIIAASFKNYKATTLITTGSILLAIFFVACGYAHIIFYDFVKEFIPAYIPFRGFLTYFTAGCLIAGGIGILIPPIRTWAALLSGIMLTGWFFMLHIPRLVANPGDPGERMGVFESLSFAGIFFVLAALFNKKR